MDLEILNRRSGPWSIQFAGTVETANAWKVLVLELLARMRSVCVRNRHHGSGVNSCIAHHAFERVVWIGTLQLSETGNEPAGRRRLFHYISVHSLSRHSSLPLVPGWWRKVTRVVDIDVGLESRRIFCLFIYLPLGHRVEGDEERRQHRSEEPESETG